MEESIFIAIHCDVNVMYCNKSEQFNKINENMQASPHSQANYVWVGFVYLIGRGLPPPSIHCFIGLKIQSRKNTNYISKTLTPFLPKTTQAKSLNVLTLKKWPEK